MAICYLKYLFIICGSTYAFPKILNLSTSQSSKSTLLLSAHILLLPLGISFLRQYVISLSLVIMATISVAAFKFAYKADFNRTIVAALVSYSISYTVYAISLPIVAVISHTFAPLSYSLTFVAAAGCIQLLLVYFLFRIKRLRHGLSFWMIYTIAMPVSSLAFPCLPHSHLSVCSRMISRFMIFSLHPYSCVLWGFGFGGKPA